ncbi:hypothetical protein H113_02349, partial [Trichophyton rubrum MR1459]
QKRKKKLNRTRRRLLEGPRMFWFYRRYTQRQGFITVSYDSVTCTDQDYIKSRFEDVEKGGREGQKRRRRRKTKEKKRGSLASMRCRCQHGRFPVAASYSPFPGTPFSHLGQSMRSCVAFWKGRRRPGKRPGSDQEEGDGQTQDEDGQRLHCTNTARPT